MYKLLITENDAKQLNTLITMIHTTYPQFTILSATSYEQALTYIDNTQIIFDFFILNIPSQQVNEKNDGIALGRHIRSISYYRTAPIVFLTTFLEPIYRAVNELHCMYYLLKPYSPETILQTISEVLTQPTLIERPLVIKSNSGVIFKIFPSQIVYINASLKMIELHTIYEHFFSREFSLKQLLEKLSYSNFIQCHKSYLINLDFLSSYDKTANYITLRIQNKKALTIPIGRTYKKHLNEKLG